VAVNVRTLLVSLGLVVVTCGGGYSQPQPTPSIPAIPPPPAFPGVTPGIAPPPGVSIFPAVGPNLPSPFPTSPTPVATPAPAPAPEPPVDQLLDQLERVQVQKAELEKKEKELKAAVLKKLQQQTERLNKLGVAPKAAESERVGRIIIEGNTNTPNEKILGMLGMHPGEVLKPAAIEEARTKLEKAGFRGVTVKVLHNELDDVFKDIHVQVTEPKIQSPLGEPSSETGRQ
jgi:hypothetical protein